MNGDAGKPGDETRLFKACKVCGELKPLSSFYRAAGMRDGHRSDCKACNLAGAARRYRANPKPAIERARQWAKLNPEKYRGNLAAYRASGKKRESDRKSHLKRTFGLSVEEYNALLAAQAGGCAVCGRPPSETISLHVDHDHESGDVRGLLCFPCNNALGLLQESGEVITSALGYLERFAGREHEKLIRARVAALAKLRQAS